MRTPKQRLQAARDYLEKTGLTKGRFSVAGRNTPCCAWGALVHTELPDDCAVLHLLDMAAPGDDIVVYNDLPSTTLNDVLAVFDRAIKAIDQVPAK